MKKMKSIFMITLLALGVAEQSSTALAAGNAESVKTDKSAVINKATANEATNTQSVDDWMPDKNLQKYLLDNYPDLFPDGVVTEEGLSDKYSNIYINIKDVKEYGITNFTGLEKTTGFGFYLSYNVDDINYLKSIGLSTELSSKAQFLFSLDNIVTLDQYNEVGKAMDSFENSPKYYLTGDVIYDQFSTIYNYHSIPVDITIHDNSLSGKSANSIEDGDEYTFKVNGKKVVYKVSNYTETSDSSSGNNNYKFKLILVSDFDYDDLANGSSDLTYIGTAYPESRTDSDLFFEMHFAPNPDIQGKAVTVHYQDEDGKKIAPDEVLQGQKGSPYETKQKDIAGYSFKNIIGDPKGVFTGAEQTVTYIYTKSEESAEDAAPVHVEYVDELGAKISEGYDLTGKIGDTKKAEKKDIDGYVFKEFQDADDVDGNVILGDKERTIKVVYTKSADDNNEGKDNDNNNGNGQKPGNNNDGNKDSKPRLNGNGGSPRNNVTASSNGSRHLPQTGENNSIQNILSIIGITLLTGISYITLSKRKGAK